MSSICHNCGSEVPEGCSFCLKCFSEINECNLSDEMLKNCEEYIKENNVTDTKKVAGISAAIKNYTPSRKKLLYGGMCVAGLILVFGLTSLFSIATSDGFAEGGKEEIYVQVTEPDGTPVTDINGENVYTVVETETSEKNFLGRLFSGLVSGNDSNTNAENLAVSDNLKTADGSGDNNGKSVDSVLADGKHDTGDNGSSSPSSSSGNNSVLGNNGTTNGESSSSYGKYEFSYEAVKNGIVITGCNGNANDIVVPAYIDNQPVIRLSGNVFSGLSSVKTITFENASSGSGRYLSFTETAIFNNLPKLESITLSADTTSYFVDANGEKTGYLTSFYNAFNNLPNLKCVNVNGSGNTISSSGGVLYGSPYVDGNSLTSVLYYPEGKKDSAYSTPSSVTVVDSYAFKNNKSLSKITFGKNVKKVYNCIFSGCDALSCFEVESGNVAVFYSYDGVLLGNSSVQINGQQYRTIYAYPPVKTDSTFEIKNDGGAPFIIASGFNSNPYLTKLILPSARIQGDLFTDKNAPQNLSFVCLPSGDELSSSYAYVVESCSKGRCSVEYY